MQPLTLWAQSLLTAGSFAVDASLRVAATAGKRVRTDIAGGVV
jgi:hypothetical protein